MARVLILDDEVCVLRALGRVMRHRGHDVISATSSGQIGDDPFDCAILDLELNGETGVECARAILLAGLTDRIMFHSGASDATLLNQAAQLGAVVTKGALDALMGFVDAASGLPAPAE
jgi:ActR/RegA family two-component response regulator